MLDLPQEFGKYVLVDRIAIGGMAEIFKAKAAGLGGFQKLLAIKRLHPRYSEDQDFIRMLVDEAKIAVQLSHMNIAQIFDLGREDDLVYIAMEFIDGRDLYRLLKRLAERDLMMPYELAVFIAMEMLAGLDYAHRKTDERGNPLHLIHRDISPQNILISWEGEVKIVDFGIAKAQNRIVETQSGVIKGKFYYMSPEQARGDSLDQRSDLFSAGIVLYEMLTGTLMYGEEDDVTLLSRVRRAEITPPTELRRDIPQQLEKIVMRALHRDPKARYDNAHDFHRALSKFHYNLDRPFDRVSLGSYVREQFEQGQAHAVDYRERFMTKFDYNENEELASGLLYEDLDDTRLHPGREHGGGMHHEEGVFHADEGEFEATATDATGGPAAFMDDDDLDAKTSVYLGNSDVLEEHVEVLNSDELAIIEDAVPQQAGPPMPRYEPPPPAPPPRPKVSHADIVELDNSDLLQSYNEATAVTSIGQVEGQRRPTGTDELTDVPLTIKLLFVVGLAVILMMGGAIAAVGAVMIDQTSSEDELTASATGPSRDGSSSSTTTGTGLVASKSGEGTSVMVTVSGPPIARVDLEGFPVAASPASFEGVTPGKTYDLKVSAPGFVDYSETVEVGEQALTKSITLERKTGKLNVSSDPPGATIKIDGEEHDKKTPTLVEGVTYGEPHQIELSLDGYEAFEKTVKFDGEEPGALQSVDATLVKEDDDKPTEVAGTTPTPRVVRNTPPRARPKPRTNVTRRDPPPRKRTPPPTTNEGGYGFISVSAKPPGKVIIGGRSLPGYTPVIRHKVRAGVHAVVVVFPSIGGKRKRKTVAVRAGKNTNVTFSP